MFVRWKGWGFGINVRSHVNIKSTTEYDQYYMLVVGNDYGELKMFKYPCITIQEPIVLKAHSG